MQFLLSSLGFPKKHGSFSILLSSEFEPHRRAQEVRMPEKETMERAKEDLREGKSPSTAAGEFVREEIEHVREGKHGARSPEQAIAIGLSKARRAGIPLKAPARGKTSEETRQRAEKDLEKGKDNPESEPEGSTERGRSTLKAMQNEPKSTASHDALSKHAKRSAGRSKRSRSA